MQNIDVAIECGNTGLWYGRIIGFLGTHARAASKPELHDELLAEFRYHLQWLQRHEEPVTSFAAQDWNIIEEVSGIEELGESGGEVALFDSDIFPIDGNYLETTFRYMGYNREDLLDLCRNIDSVQSKEIPIGKRRSIDDILQHVCNAEEFYLSRLGVDEIYERYLKIPVADADRLPTLERLDVVRNACIKTLKDVIPAMGDTVFQRTEFTRYPKERWTAHKVLRRFLEHEREHIYNIREYLRIPLRPVL